MIVDRPSEYGMNDRNDAIPQLILIDERSRRETAELCGDEADVGLRCTLTKGHLGPHECLAIRGPMRWHASKAS
jgi:hypothetical protein